MMMKKLIELYDKYGAIIKAAAKHHGIDEKLLGGLIWQESRGDPRAVSHCGAYGLTQFMPATAEDRGYNLETPLNQIYAGADYLAWIDKNFSKGDTIKLLAGYNAGVGRLKNDKWKQFKETVDYVRKVLEYSSLYGDIIMKAIDKKKL